MFPQIYSFYFPLLQISLSFGSPPLLQISLSFGEGLRVRSGKVVSFIIHNS
ncbi:MAG: hypothetical protein ACYDCN_09945 [Bacteroidia bacterium]